MAEALQEFVDSGGLALRVDREAGVLKGVKLIGLRSRNGRRYREAALASAAPLYESAKVNVNHPKDDPAAPRDYEDRLGVIRGVEYRADEGLFGDLHFNPKHALAEQLVWDAEHNPANVGLSHNVMARTSRDGATTVVEEIAQVQSVDLVADPAATDGLFEQADAQQTVEPATRCDDLALETLRRERPALCERVAADARRELQQEVTALREAAERRRRHDRAAELLAEQGIAAVTPQTVRSAVGDALYDLLLECDDDQRAAQLLNERAELLRRQSPSSAAGAPRSAEQLPATRVGVAVASGKDLAQALRAA